MNLQNLTDLELIDTAAALAVRERESTVKLLWHLIEIESRKLFLKQGYSSMYKFLTDKLKYSEAQALRRLRAARCMNETPEIEQMLIGGKVNLCTLALAHVELRSENKQAVLAKISGVSKREAELILAEHKPEKRVRDSIKPIGRKRASSSEALPLLENKTTVPGNGKISSKISDVEVGAKKSVSKPIRHHVQFSAKGDLVRKLEEVQNLMSGKFPKGASLEQVFGECLEVYLEKNCPKRKALRKALRQARSKEVGRVESELKTMTKAKTKIKSESKVESGGRDRYIPTKVRAEVMQRDGYQCTFTSEDGRRCGCKWDIELDHIISVAVDGKSQADNLRVLCRAHNQLAAEDAFGRGVVKACKKKAKAA